jgi:hypothetical protein
MITTSAKPITEALRSQGLAADPANFHWLEWRIHDEDAQDTGIYVQVHEHPQAGDPCIGKMSTRLLAEDVVNAHNAVLLQVQQPDFGKGR